MSVRFLMARDRITVFCAIPVVLLGLTVMAGWIVRMPVLIQVVPGMSPMMFNTAVGLIVGAAGLSGLATRSKITAFCGAILIAVGGLTLAEYAFARDFGIDQLLMRDWHHGLTPGRMGVNAAACFLALGLVDVFGQTRAGGILVLPAAIGLLSVSAAALLGYATGLEFTYQWGGTTRMAVHTAAAVLLLGVGLFASGRRHVGRGSQTWLAVGVGGCVAGITLVVSLGLLAEQRRAIAAESRTAAAHVAEVMAGRVDEIVLALARLDERWATECSGACERDVAMYIRDYPELTRVGWVDRSQGRVAFFHRSRGSDPGLEPEPRDVALRLAQQAEARTSARGVAAAILQEPASLELVVGRRRSPAGPVFLATLDLADLLARSPQENERRVKVGLSVDGHEIGEVSRGSDPSADARVFDSSIAGLVWHFRVSTLGAARSHYSDILLLGGLLIACFVGATVYLWQTSGARLRQIRTLNATLEGRVAERTLQLVAANSTLEGSIRQEREAVARLREQEHHQQQAEAEVRALNETLESRVERRTDELSDANVKLFQAKARLQGVLDAATHIAIVATDPKGIIRVFNAGAEQMLQYRADELVGLRTPEIFHDPAELLARAQELSEERGRVVTGFGAFVEARRRPFDQRQWTYVRKDHSRLDVNVIVTAVRGPAGAIEGYLGIATDITARKRLEAEVSRHNQQLAEQTSRAEEANRAKSEFLATMSHEIRTPMNGVVGMTEVLLLTELSQEQRGYAELVLASADSLLTIINDILDFSKVESGKMNLEAIDFVLRTAIEEAADLLAERAQSKGLEMACLIQHDIPTLVRGDPGRLRQILTNLLGNAIKFTEAGEVVLRARLAQDSGDEVTVRFDITDTGIGISPAGRSRLFQSFSQADSSTTRKFGGTGLGLAISKSLSELMGGEIGVESEPGKGSTFWFTVRLKKTPALLMAPPIPREDLHELHALVVDDNDTNLQLVRAQTRRWGMACDTATRGPEAVQMIAAASRQRPYDVVILDMQMPGMDGFELAEIIKAEPANEQIKLVLMTSMAQRGHGARSEQAGIAAFLTKPVRQAQLYDCLSTLMAPSSDASPQERKQMSKIITAHSLKEAKDLRRPRVLLAEDNQTNQLAAVRMLEMLGYQVDVAVNGIEAVNACRDVDYGIVLMDNQMPEMDGLSASREIRKRELAEGKPPVPIIALTANAMQGDREKCLAAGMSDYLSKPFKVAILSEMLGRWDRPSPSLDVAAPPAGAPVHLESAIDSKVLDELRDPEAGTGANDFVIALIDLYLADSTSRMAALHDAAARCDWPALRFVTHTLKGSSGTVGASRLAAICEDLEERARNPAFDGAADLITALEDEFKRVLEALQIELASTAAASVPSPPTH